MAADDVWIEMMELCGSDDLDDKKKATIGNCFMNMLSLFVTSVPDFQVIHPADVEIFPSGLSRQAMASPESRCCNVLMCLAWS